MSSSHDDAAAAAATDAGLDLDDELKQLLKEQEDFLKQSKRPAAKVTRLGRSPATAKPPAPASAAEKEENDDEAPSGPQILGSVVERDVIELNIQNVNVMPRAHQATGFPVAQRRSGESLFGKRQRQPLTGTKAGAGAAKPSRFSAMKQQQAVTIHEREETDGDATPRSAEQQEIDRTNNARLQEMSLDEIRQAQQELLQSLDPQLVEKLMGKKKKSSSSSSKATVSSAKSTRIGGTGAGVAVGKTIVNHNDSDDDEREKPKASGAPLSTPSASIDLAKIQSEDELHAQVQLLPPEERAKHEWMQSVPAPPPSAATTNPKTKSDGQVRARKPKLEATAERFDFDGECISAAGEGPRQQPAAHSGLFHHGDEPEAAGYTMAELLHLARSTVASQRAMALTTITKILRQRAQSVERNDLSRVYPRVLPNDLPITMRIGLDDQNYTALSAAIGALHAFLVAQSSSEGSEDAFEGRFGTVVAPTKIHLHQNVRADEVRSGDSDTVTRLSFETPQTEEVVYIDTGESPEDGSAISDEELTFLDPVQGFLNMDIGTRLRYILESIQLPDQSATEKMLDILIQIASHSPKAAKDIGTNAKLVKAIQRKFIENEDVLTLQEGGEAALRLTLKALVLVRALCQGSRAVAAFLIGNGVIQSTKGFLAIQGGASLSPATSAYYFEIQRESLRVWRVLLSYGLDFHCFAYLFPILCGFRGADLVRPATAAADEKKTDDADQTVTTSVAMARPASVTAALFAALEAFCGLEAIHEAQHYFHQLGFFATQAKDEVLARLNSADSEGVMVIATALRFLSATAALVTKFHLDSGAPTEVLARVQQQQPKSLENSSEVLSAVVRFHQQVLFSGLLPDDQDDEDAVTQFFASVKPQLLQHIAQGIERSPRSVHEVALTCDLLTVTGDLVTRTQDNLYADDAFVAQVYAFALTLMEKFVSGQEHLLSELLTRLLFAPVVLQRVGFFANAADALAMSRVLVPIYQALMNTSSESEAHSRHNFAARNTSSPADKSSCQLRVPQYEDAYIGSNLPLPGFWMFSPFSRMELASSSSKTGEKQKSDPTRAESDEMKLIVSATCRYLYQLETATTKSSVALSSSCWANVAVAFQSEMRAEDKLFHLLHVFFAGADVLFDEHVDTALSQLLPRFALQTLTSRASPTLLYDGMLRNLRKFQHLEDPSGGSSDATDGASSTSTNDVSFSTDEQLVMTFVEKLVGDFTSLSYANAHFARCVTLLLANDFPIAVRKWVWKELQDCRLLHVLQPFDDARAARATFVRCTTGGVRGQTKIHDAQLLQLMAQALSQQQITLTRGAFAYTLAVHHVAVYLFGGERDQQTMSFARQLLAQDLVRGAPSHVWLHLLSYEASGSAGSEALDAFATTQAIKAERVERMATQAGLAADQVAKFRAAVAKAGEAE